MIARFFWIASESNASHDSQWRSKSRGKDFQTEVYPIGIEPDEIALRVAGAVAVSNWRKPSRR